MRLILALGVTLFEVLVSLLILSLVLLGLDVIEVSTFHMKLQAYYSSLAEQQLDNMEERLRMLGAREGLAQQLELWNQQNRQVLPLGRGWVSGHYPAYTLNLYWGEKAEGVCEKTVEEHEGCLTEQFTAGLL